MKTSLLEERFRTLLLQFIRDDRGIVVSAELMIILTVAVLALVTGVSAVSTALTLEYTDIANALTGLDQSYSINGHCAPGHAFNGAMGFNDAGQTFVVQEVTPSIVGCAEVGALVEAECVVEHPTSYVIEESELVVEEVIAEPPPPVKTQVTEVCPLDELTEIEARVNRLRTRLEQQNVFDCDRPQF